jgi:hypothetical protein
MSYAALTDVNALVPQAPFTPQTLPTDAVVTAMLADVSLQIDSTLSQLYVTPVIAAPDSLSMLKNICTWGALGRAQEARNTGVVAELQGVKSVWTKKFEEALAKLADPDDPFILPDAPRNGDFIEKLPGEVLGGSPLEFTGLGHGGEDAYHLHRPHMRSIF